MPRHFNPVDVPRGNIHLPTAKHPERVCENLQYVILGVERLISNKWGESSHAFKTHIIADAAFIQSCLTATTLSPEGQGYRKRDCIPCR